MSRADAREAASLNPHVHWIEIEGAGHHIKYDRFDEYLTSVTAFLNSLD